MVRVVARAYQVEDIPEGPQHPSRFPGQGHKAKGNGEHSDRVDDAEHDKGAQHTGERVVQAQLGLHMVCKHKSGVRQSEALCVATAAAVAAAFVTVWLESRSFLRVVSKEW